MDDGEEVIPPLREFEVRQRREILVDGALHLSGLLVAFVISFFLPSHQCVWWVRTLAPLGLILFVGMNVSLVLAGRRLKRSKARLAEMERDLMERMRGRIPEDPLQ